MHESQSPPRSSRATSSLIPGLIPGLISGLLSGLLLGAVTPLAGCAVSAEDAELAVAGQPAALSTDPSAPQLTSSPIFCNQTPPAGAKVAPDPPRYSGGTCPTLRPGANAMLSTGHPRSFLIVAPTDLKPDELLPTVFLWHWLGGSADEFLRKGEVQAAVDSQRFLAIIPEAKSDMLFKWPFNVTDKAARQEEEFKFFDDMLSCVSAQFNVNRNCVSTAGVSAGALFTDQLVGARSEYLASGISLSGGVGDGSSGALVKPWASPTHKVPMMVLWGGMLDICIVINFQTGSRNLEAALQKDGNFFLECVHNCRHGEPPLSAPAGLSKYASIWRFFFDHPYWLNAGDSPYKSAGIPVDAGYPSWCGIGLRGSTTRTGSCPAPGC